jgi:hypothetical protein
MDVSVPLALTKALDTAYKAAADDNKKAEAENKKRAKEQGAAEGSAAKRARRGAK